MVVDSDPNDTRVALKHAARHSSVFGKVIVL